MFFERLELILVGTMLVVVGTYQYLKPAKVVEKQTIVKAFDLEEQIKKELR